MMGGYFRTYVRDLVPTSYQVPAKYWYGRVRGTLEPEMKILGSLVRPSQRAIDVGGNRGVYAYELWRLGCTVEVFEPNPVCCAVLQAWCRHKGAVTIHPVALSSKAGDASLHIPVDDAGIEHDASASLEHTDFGSARDEIIRTVTLDSFGYQDVALIKIDVEGHEQSVLEGARETLARAKPALLIEIEQRHNKRPIADIFRSVCLQGYRGFYLDGEKLQDLQTFDPLKDQSLSAFQAGTERYINNFLFLHHDQLKAGRYPALLAAT